jgi:hypothetical protein
VPLRKFSKRIRESFTGWNNGSNISSRSNRAKRSNPSIIQTSQINKRGNPKIRTGVLNCSDSRQRSAAHDAVIRRG